MGERKRQPKAMSDAEKASYAKEMRHQGHTYAAIGRRIGMSPNGVKYMVERVTNPGRYYADEDEAESRPLPGPAESW